MRVSGTNLVITGSGGVPDATYYVLASTNLALSPVTSWDRIATNVFSPDGQFSNDIPITPSVPQEFFVIVTNTPVTVASGLMANNKTYDGNTTATLSSNNVVLAGVLPADAGKVWLSTNGYVASFVSANAGTEIGVTVSGLTLTGSAAPNYTLTQPSLVASISPMPVTVASGLTANNKVYDGTTVATITSNTVVLNGVLAGDVGNVRLLTNGYVANFGSASVGTDIAVTVSGLSLTGSAVGNYTLSQPTGLTANITKLGVTISSGITANNKVYDGTTVATITSNTVVLNGVLEGDVGNVRLLTNGYAANFSGASVGTNIVVTVSGLSLTGSAAGNYTLSQPTNLMANITAPTTISGLVAAYSFDEGSGMTVGDDSGDGNSGTISGATWTTSGKYGNALVFNGTSALVTVNNSTTLQLSNAMTLEAWVNPQFVTNQWTDIIMKYNDNYYLNGTSDNGPPAVGGTFHNSDTPLYLTRNLPLNTWTFLAATYDRTALKFYTNGVLAASASDATSIATSSNPLNIGGDPFFGQYFQGTIDQVRIYNVALTAAQIHTDMTTQIFPVPDTQPPTAPTNLVAIAVGRTQIELSWSASIDNVGVTGYLLERQDPGNANFTQVAMVTGTNYFDTGLAGPTNYSYRVRATDAAGNLSAYSPVASVTTLPYDAATDNFNRPNGSLGTNWLNTLASQGNLVITNNMVGVDRENSNIEEFWTGNSFSDNQYSQATLTSFGPWTGVILRADGDYDPVWTNPPSGSQFYLGLVLGPNNYGIYHFINNGYYLEAAGSTEAWQTNDVLRLEISGSVEPLVTMYRNGKPVLIWLVADAPDVKNGGSPGLGICSPTGDHLTIGSWQGGSLNPDTNAPTVPANLTASAVTTNEIDLNWTASTDDVGVVGYLVERSNGAGSTNFFLLDAAVGINYFDTNSTTRYTMYTTNPSTSLIPGTTYNYRIRATDAAGNLSGYSEVATTTATNVPDTQPPTAPTNLVATAVGGTQIQLSWSASTDNVSVTAYLLERQDPGNANFAQVAMVTGTNYLDAGLVGPTNYSYRVRATDAAGNLSAYSPVASATTLPYAVASDDFNRPNGPLGANWSKPSVSTNNLVVVNDQVGVDTEDQHIFGFWSANNFNDDQYSQAQITKIGPWTGVILRADSIQDRFYMGFVFATNDYRIYARWDGAYDSLATGSNVTWQVGDILRLEVRGTVNPVTITMYRNGNPVLSWTSSDSTMVRTGGSPGLGIYSPTGDGLTMDNWEGGNVAPDTQPPTAPTSLVATAINSSQITLNWDASTDNVYVTGYLVEREAPGATNFVEVGTASGTTYNDVGLTPNSSYSYRVRATDGAGNLSGYSGVATAATPSASSDLVAAYSFDEGSGTTVTDASGNGNNGTVSGATWTTSGKYGDALVFNGTSALVTINNSSSLELTAGMTLEAWVNPSVVSAVWRDVIYKGNDNYYLSGTSYPNGYPAMGGTFGGDDVPLYGLATLPVNTWTYLAATYDGTTVRLYVNGTLVASQPQTGVMANSTSPLQIGGDSIYGQYFHGMIDEVRVYDRALSVTEIQTDMAAPVAHE